MKRLFDALERGRHFVAHDVWRIGMPGEEIPHGFIIRQIRVAILLVKGVVRDDLLVRASALTFATILSIVPFLAILFFIIQTFNVGGAITDLLSPVLGPQTGQNVSEEDQRNRELRDRLLALLFQGFEQSEADEESHLENPVKIIVKYAEHGANPRTLTLAGVLFVLTTVFGLMMNIENSFNIIWGLKRTRSWYRMVSDYLMILLLLPFVVGGMLSVTAVLESASIANRLGPFELGLRSIQYGITWIAFTALYFAVPNTRVKFRYALLAGIVAGTLWSLLSLAYVKFQFGLPRYNPLYSTFAQVPVLLMWVFCSWIVLLFGAELTFAYQNERTFAMERFAEVATYAYCEALGLWTMIELGRRFDAGLPGLSAETAAHDWNVPLRLLNNTLNQLEEAHLAVQCVPPTRGPNPPMYQPSRSLDKITVQDVIHCMRESGRDPSQLREHNSFKEMLEIITRHEAGATEWSIAECIVRLDQADRARYGTRECV